MRPILILGFAVLVTGACDHSAGPPVGPENSASFTAAVTGHSPASSLSIVDALGEATPTTRFSVFGYGGIGVTSSQFAGPQFVLAQPTTITEIGGFLNNCKDIVAGTPQCPGTLPLIVQIRPAVNGLPDPSTVLASFALSHDNDPLVIAYESVAINVTLGPGTYFALFGPQGGDEGGLLGGATDPFAYQAGLITLGTLNPTTGYSALGLSMRGAVRIRGARATPQAAIRLLMADVSALVSEGVLRQEQGDGLNDKLSAAIASLNRSGWKAACNQLGAFVNQVNGLVRARKLPAAAGQDLIDAAQSVPTQIGCVVATNYWTTAAPMPAPQVFAAAGVINGILYAVGGVDPNGLLGIVEAYDPVANEWTAKPPLPTQRLYLAAGVVNDVLYAVGGLASNGFVGTVEAYDPVTNSWTTKAPLPTRRGHLAVGVVNDILYAVGGANENGDLATVEAYDPMTDSWTAKAPLPAPREGLCVGVVNDLLYAVGGYGPSGTTGTVDAYDPVTNSWTAQTPLPTPRLGLGCGVVNGILYAVGGAGQGTGFLDAVEAYDPATNTWAVKAPLPTARGYPAVSVVSALLYAAGGIDPAGNIVGSVEVYHP